MLPWTIRAEKKPSNGETLLIRMMTDERSVTELQEEFKTQKVAKKCVSFIRKEK